VNVGIASLSPSRLTLVAGLSLAVLLGLALRLAAAQGGIWTDEAWSVLYARDAGGPWGVISSINHDNNHHINSWWLQLVGADASSLAMRSLSVATSTATILVAGLIGLRRGVAAAIVTALLFALSPILVLYGSEARGYAPMLLCFLLMIWTVLRWTEREDSPFPSLQLALLALIGAFSHLLMLPGVAIIGLWVLILFAERKGWRGAIPHAVPAMAPVVIAVISVLVLVIVMASGRSSGVEHNLAKVGVEGSNPFARSSFLPENQRFRRPATLEILETTPRRDPHCLHIVSNFGTGWGVVGKAGRSS
jgi:4-amino-4-deoxy-L-arabinose transferase-like glycosyltransferase